MAGSGPAQDRAREEGLRDTIRRRAREAEAAAYEGVKQAIRGGQDLQLKTPREVLAYGAELLREREARAGDAVSNAARVAKRQALDALDRLGQNQVVRPVAVVVARKAGRAAGILRGGVHAAEGLAGGAMVVNRLLDPLDILKSPPGESAAEQLSRGALNVGRNTVDYVRNGISDPESVVHDVKNQMRQWNRELNPSATPVAPTFTGELRRNFDIGQNQGELAFEVGSLVVGGPAAKAVKGLGRVSDVGNVGKYLAQGANPGVAAHLAELYPLRAMGSHFVPRRFKLPEILGGGPLPREYMDGVFNRLAPPNISRGDMYELHYKVDPLFNHARLPPRLGRRAWSGAALGLEKYGPLGRAWYGSPPPLKARVGGLGAGAGSASDDLNDGDAKW